MSPIVSKNTKVMMKLSVIFFTFASVTVHGREQYLRTVESETQCAGNTIGWVDSKGDGCDWYEAMDLPGCPIFGRSYEGSMGVADDNCCFCAGTNVSVISRVIP